MNQRITISLELGRGVRTHAGLMEKKSTNLLNYTVLDLVHNPVEKSPAYGLVIWSLCGEQLNQLSMVFASLGDQIDQINQLRPTNQLRPV